MTTTRLNRRPEWVDDVREVAESVPGGALLAEAIGDDAPPDVVAWLAQLLLLEGVPFDVMVADSRMLPKESIRFFHVDQNWLAAAVDGALSVGTQSSQDTTLYRLAQARVKRGVRERSRHQRGIRRGRPNRVMRTPLAAAGGEDGAPVWTGFLLRSQLVQGWPGMEITAEDAEGPLQTLRIDRLSSEVMIAIFQDLPTKVSLTQPSEGLALGGIDGKTPGQHVLVPRGLGLHDKAAGVVIDPKQTVDAVMRKDKDGKDTRVIDVKATLGKVQGKLTELGAWKSGDPFGAASFALQVLRVPEVQDFDTTCTAGAKDDRDARPLRAVATRSPGRVTIDLRGIHTELGRLLR